MFKGKYEEEIVELHQVIEQLQQAVSESGSEREHLRHQIEQVSLDKATL